MYSFFLKTKDTNENDNIELVINNVKSHQTAILNFDREELGNLRAVIDAYLARATKDYLYTFNTDNIIDQIHQELYGVEEEINPDITDERYKALSDFTDLDDTEQHKVVNTIIENRPFSIDDRIEEYENALINHVIMSLIDNQE